MANGSWVYSIIALPWTCNDAVQHPSATIKLLCRPHYRLSGSIISSNLQWYGSACTRASSPPIASRCEATTPVFAFHVNIVCNNTLSEHRCYYGLPTKQRSSLPPRPKEGPLHHRGYRHCFHPDQNDIHDFIFTFWPGFVVESAENPIWNFTRI